MANYHMEVQVISRGKGRSVTKLASYIAGKNLYDSYLNKTHHTKRQDVLYCNIFQPDNAPAEYHDLQLLCNEIDAAEKRYDARTAREFKGSLPNELPIQAQIQIVDSFVHKNFISHGLCAIAAIHEGRNETDPSRNNPHVHIIVPTREVGPDGFSIRKTREYDKKKYIEIWRKDWALVQNRAYERHGLDIRVSHESLEVQGVKREPVPHLSRIDFQREQRGEQTPAGDRKRAIILRNREKEREDRHTRVRSLSLERSL